MKITAKNGTVIDHRKVRRIIRRAMKIQCCINKRLGASAESEQLKLLSFRKLRLVSNRPGKFSVKSA